jgi:hypothetical protein
MQLIQTLTNNVPNSYYGYTMASLDFNGDGIDDLVVYSYGSIELGRGRIDVYWGGNPFDNVPDLTREGEFIGQIGYEAVLNVGDVNGDGFEDLLIYEKLPDYETTYLTVLRFYYGGPDADLIPDHEIVVSYGAMGPNLYPLECLGDVNNDGYDDLGCKRWYADGDSLDLSILLGGSFQVVNVVQDVSNSISSTISGVGDVNNDGFDDYMVGYAYATGYPNLPRYRYVYYGGNGINLDNRVLLMESDEINQVYPGGHGIGDFNGDGYDDMIITTFPLGTNNLYMFKLGSSTLPTSPEYEISYSEHFDRLIRIDHNSVVHGDFNGDGYSDVLGADFEAGFWNGIAGLWIGSDNPNGLYDMHIDPPATSPMHQFGWCVVSGDFNGDGYCDVALSAPNSHFESPSYPGYVYVYAGNAQLADINTDNNEETVTPPIETYNLLLYPNPMRRGQLRVNYVVNGKLPVIIKSAELEVRNIKGQILGTYNLKLHQVKLGTGNITLKKFASGIYLTTLIINEQRITSSKLIIK